MAKSKTSSTAKFSVVNPPAAVGTQPDVAGMGYDDLTVSFGKTGLKNYSGIISEELRRDLDGLEGIKSYAEMRDNSPVIGAFLYAINMLIKQVSWTMEAVSDSKEDKDAAQLCDEALSDMETSWQDFLSEALSMLVFGWTAHEIIFKICKGPNFVDPSLGSKYNDNKIRLKGLPIRAQESLNRWINGKDELGAEDPDRIVGMEQILPVGGSLTRQIPMSKLLLMRPSSYKNNPQGRSILRNSWITYVRSRNMQDIQAVGVERDFAGIPMCKLPLKFMRSDATAAEKATYANFQNILKKIKLDQHTGVIIPSDVDSNGNPLFSFELLTTGGAKSFDTNNIILTYEKLIASSVLADFIFLGQQQHGSYALSSDKTELFSLAVGAILDIICEAYTRQINTKIVLVNGGKIESTPRLKHGDVESIDLNAFATFIGQLASAGMPLFPDPVLENHIRKIADLPSVQAGIAAEVGTGVTQDQEVEDTLTEAERLKQQQAKKPDATAAVDNPKE